MHSQCGTRFSEEAAVAKNRNADLELDPAAYDDPDRDRDQTEPVTGTYPDVATQDPEAEQ